MENQTALCLLDIVSPEYFLGRTLLITNSLGPRPGDVYRTRLEVAKVLPPYHPDQKLILEGVDGRKVIIRHDSKIANLG